MSISQLWVMIFRNTTKHLACTPNITGSVVSVELVNRNKSSWTAQSFLSKITTGWLQKEGYNLLNWKFILSLFRIHHITISLTISPLNCNLRDGFFNQIFYFISGSKWELGKKYELSSTNNVYYKIFPLNNHFVFL